MTMATGTLEGTTLGHCKVEKLIGVGGMAKVYQGHHETLDKKVAIKVLLPNLAADTEFVARFLREARSAAKLEHPNVVPVLDAGSVGDVHYLVMQLIDGTDLHSVLKKQTKLSVKDALSVTRRVAAALDAAHSRGIIHRDIKPSNILVGKNGKVFVGDFGLAREVTSNLELTRTDTVMGSPHYMSPEQAMGEKLDARTDIYSLGATVYHMLSGKAPYDGPTPAAIMMKHVGAEFTPEPLRKLNPEVPDDLASLIEKMMGKKREGRPASMKAVLDALDPLRSTAQGPTIPAPAVPTPSATAPTVLAPTTPSPKPKKKWALPAAAAAVLIGAIAVAYVFKGGAKPAPKDPDKPPTPGAQAEAFLRDAKTLELAAGEDQTQLQRALESYRKVTKNFPDTTQATEADARIKSIAARLAMPNLNALLAAAQKAEKDAGEDPAKLEAVIPKYDAVVKAAPGSPTAMLTETHIKELKDRIVELKGEARINAAGKAYTEKKATFAATLAQLKKIRADFPDSAVSDKAEDAIADLHRAQIARRATDMAALIEHRTYKAMVAFVDPRVVKAKGTEGIENMILVTVMGIQLVAQAAITKVEPDPSKLLIQGESAASMPMNVTLKNKNTGEQTTPVPFDWLFFENEWYVRIPDQAKKPPGEELLTEAQKLERDAGDDLAKLQAAIAKYREVVTAAPGSSYATTARQRIGDLEAKVRAHNGEARLEAAVKNFKDGTTPFSATRTELEGIRKEGSGTPLETRAVKALEEMHQIQLGKRAESLATALGRRDWNAVSGLVDPRIVKNIGLPELRKAFSEKMESKQFRITKAEVVPNSIVVQADKAQAVVRMKFTGKVGIIGKPETNERPTDWILGKDDWYYLPPGATRPPEKNP